MATRSRYWWLCALSGIVWGLIGVVLGRPAFKDVAWGGLIASPLIGLIAGAVAWPWIRARLKWLALGALVNLYLTAALFGLAFTLYPWCVGQSAQGEPFESALRRARESAIAVPIGITMTGYVLFLWPLAVANHRWLARWR